VPQQYLCVRQTLLICQNTMTNNENYDEVIDEIDEEQEEQQEELTELQKALQDAEKWKTRFKGLAKKTNDTETDDRDVDTIVEEKLEQREVTSKIEHVMDQIPTQYREAFQAEFDELKWDRKLTNDNVDKLIKSALSLSIPDGDDTFDSIKAVAMWWSQWSTKQSYKKKVNKNVEDSNKLLKQMWIL